MLASTAEGGVAAGSGVAEVVGDGVGVSASAAGCGPFRNSSVDSAPTSNQAVPRVGDVDRDEDEDERDIAMPLEMGGVIALLTWWPPG